MSYDVDMLVKMGIEVLDAVGVAFNLHELSAPNPSGADAVK